MLLRGGGVGMEKSARVEKGEGMVERGWRRGGGGGGERGGGGGGGGGGGEGAMSEKGITGSMQVERRLEDLMLVSEVQKWCLYGHFTERTTLRMRCVSHCTHGKRESRDLCFKYQYQPTENGDPLSYRHRKDKSP